MASRASLPKLFWITSILMTMSACGGAGLSDRSDQPGRTHYAGRTIDLDSGAPLSGVIVTFFWYVSDPPGQKFVAALEVRTGADGKFEVPLVPKLKVASAEPLQSPAGIFYLPGYVDWHHRSERVDGSPRLRNVIEFKKAEDPVQAVKDVTIPRIVPLSQIPVLVGALNQERTRLGLPALSPSE